VLEQKNILEFFDKKYHNIIQSNSPFLSRLSSGDAVHSFLCCCKSKEPYAWQQVQFPAAGRIHR
jgi:hypothetical protein